MARRRFGGLVSPSEPVNKPVEKSYGESVFAHILGGNQGSGSWGFGTGSANWDRQELANHYKGFNYLAIQPLMKEIGSMTPHAAYRRDGYKIKEAKQKALAAGNWGEFKSIGHRYLNPFERKKAIAPVQTHEELEPVGSDNELVRLLRNPNGPDTSATFFRKLVMFWRLYGEFYIWMVPPRIERLTGKKHPPAELWVLPSHWVWPKHDPEKNAIFSEFEIRPYAGYYPVEAGGSVGLGWYPGAGAKTVIPADQVVYYGEPNPSGFLNGYSALTAISHWIDCSDSIDRSRTAQFQNGAFPGVVLEFDKSALEPDRGTLDRLEARISSAYAGVRRTGKPMILSPGVKMRPLDNKPYEMSYTESADQIKDWVFAAQGTGQSIVGLVEQTTFNNVWGARANFYSNTIKPMCGLLSEIFTEKIAILFDPELMIYWPDTTPVDPDLELREIDTMLRNNVMTINEVCVLRGLEQKEWGDKPLDLLKLEWTQQNQQAQPGAAPPGQPGEAPPVTPAEGPPKDQTLGSSPIHANGNPLDHANTRIDTASDIMTNHRVSPSKNGKDRHQSNLTNHRLH